jgi:4-carboxymuconolactone decarboxylase
MDTQELHDRGLKLRRELFGAAAVESRVNALGEFGAPLQQIINAYAYGDIWSRPGLPLATKSLAMIAMMAAAGKQAELRVHLKGALKNGCTPEQIREILLLVALYCGIPSANEAHKAAVEILRETAAG